MNNQDKFCIVAVGYNRPDSMKRLLDNLLAADYDGDFVDILISIDKGVRQSEVIDIAEQYEWPYGDKRIRAFSKRQGLRQHIIQCGDMTKEYTAVIILEDDIVVSECFYLYAKQSVQFYGSDRRIAGISLYKHETNVGVYQFFEPEYNGYDCYLMQFAQSWGECWTSQMWENFKSWYSKNEGKIFQRKDNLLLKKIPDNILAWDEHSWLKYYMAYIVEKDLYYVYPYHSLSTNNSERGQHNMVGSTSDYQIALTTGKNEYRFPRFEDAVKYDVFFERIDYVAKGFENKKTIMDLYGNKKVFQEGEILISSQIMPFRILDKWRLTYRPQEVNCKYPQKGEDLFVYDLLDVDKSQIKKMNTARED